MRMIPKQSLAPLVALGLVGVVATSALAATYTRPSQDQVDAFARQRDELESAVARRDFASLRRLAVTIYENQGQPVKDKRLRSELLVVVVSHLGACMAGKPAELYELSRKYARELLARPGEVLPESEAEIVYRTPWAPTSDGDPPEERKRVAEFVKHDRARVVRYYFAALQRLEKAIDPAWKPGQEPRWRPGKAEPGFVDEPATWEPEDYSSWPRLPGGLPLNFYQRGRHDPAEIPDPALRAAYVKFIDADDRWLEREVQRDALSELVPWLEHNVAIYYFKDYPAVAGADAELEGIFREFKVDAGMRARILNKISEFDNHVGLNQ